MNKDGLLIFHINTEKAFRGGEIQTLHLIRGLQERGHENCVFARPGSRILQEARDREIPCFTLPMRGEWDVISGRMLRRLMDIQKPHLLHAHTPHACSIALMARWPDKIPPIVFSRRTAFPSRKRLLRRKMKHVDALLAVSNTVRHQLLEVGIPPEKVFVAESGTDFSIFQKAPDRTIARRELGIPENAFVIGNISHFDKHKGQEQLIGVFCDFVKDHPDSFLLLAGEGPTRTRCESIAKNSPYEKSILFTSYRTDVERLYPAMDVFFLSSSHEGWSGVLREAMACGIPVIAVDQPSTQEQVPSGLLVSPEPQTWRGAIEQLHASGAERASLAAAAKNHAKQFTVEAMVGKTEDCYRRVLSYKPAR